MSKGSLTSNSTRLSRLGWILPGLLFAGLAFYLSSTRYHIGGKGVETDFYWDYAPAADEFLKGNFPIDHLQFRGPGYPIVLASLGWLRDTFLAGKIISNLSAGVVVSAFGYLLIHRFGLLSGLVGVAALIVNGVFLEYSIRVGTDMFFLMINVLVIVLLGVGKSPRSAGLAGLLAGWAFLTRYNGVALIAAVGLWAVVLLIRKQTEFRRRILYGLVGILLPVVPWLIAYDLGTEKNHSNPNLSNILYESEALGTVSWDDYWYGNQGNIDPAPRRLTLPDIKRIIDQASGNFTQNLLDDMESLTGALLTATALSGLVVVLFGRQSSGVWLWGLAAGLLNYIILLFVFHSPRFSLCLLPAYIALALFFFEWIKLRIRKYSVHLEKSIIIISAIALIGVTPPHTWAEALSRIDRSPDYLIEFAKKSELQSLPKGIIAARKPHLPYLLGMPFVALPILNNTSEYLDWMEDNNISYLFLSSHGAAVRPTMSGLLGSQRSLEGLRLITFKEDSPKAGFWEREQRVP